MPVDPQTQALSQLLHQIQQSQGQALLNNQTLGPGLTVQPPPAMGKTPPVPSAGPGLGSNPMLQQQLQQILQQQPPPQGPQTLGFNQPMPMQLPQADPQGQQQGQAPDISYGMSLGDIPSMG